MTARRKPKTRGLDELEVPGYVLGPIVWTIAAYAGAGVLHELHIDPRYVAAVGLGVALLSAWTAIYKRFAFSLMFLTTALLTWTTATTPWAREPAMVAAAIGVLYGIGYQALRKSEKKKPNENKASDDDAKKGRYIKLLERIGIPEGLEEARPRTPFPAGKTVHLRLPVKGITLSKLQDATEQLDIAAARAGMDVTFEFEPGRNRAEVDMHVFEHDVLADTIPLEFDRGPKSIHDPIPLGKFATGEPCSVRFREVAALMVGLKGRGKSGLINVHLAHMTGCTDAVVWMLDGKSGETVLPWIQPFLDGEVSRPAIDWPAVNESEFDAVLLAADAVRKFRSANQRPGPNASRPAVDVIVEEASVITGTTRRGGMSRVQLAQDGVTLGRSSFLDWLFATQRSTLDMLGSGSMKVNLDLRYGMGVQDAQDARSVFPDAKMAKALYRLGTGLEYRGTFLMQAPGESRAMAAKGSYVAQDVIGSMAISNAQWRAELDRETADYVHETLIAAGVPGGYYGRWDRIRETLGYQSQSQSGPETRPAETSQSRPETRPAETSQSQSPAAQAVRDAVERSRSQRERDAFDSLIAANFDAEPAETEAPVPTLPRYPETVPAILQTIMAVFHGHGMPDALPTAVILGELEQTTGRKMTGHALSRLMGLCSVSPGQGVVWDGKPVRGYKRDDIETSIKRGTWTPGAGDWKP